VFNHGRIEQVGTPVEVYERPATAFVAGFVGTSNLLTGAAARKLVGTDGTFSIRPEKIAMSTVDDPPADGAGSADGTVVDVVYAGPATRYVVDLDAGARVVVMQQNGQSSTGGAGLAGDTVRLTWSPAHVVEIPSS